MYCSYIYLSDLSSLLLSVNTVIYLIIMVNIHDKNIYYKA